MAGVYRWWLGLLALMVLLALGMAMVPRSAGAAPGRQAIVTATRASATPGSPGSPSATPVVGAASAVPATAVPTTRPQRFTESGEAIDYMVGVEGTVVVEVHRRRMYLPMEDLFRFASATWAGCPGGTSLGYGALDGPDALAQDILAPTYSQCGSPDADTRFEVDAGRPVMVYRFVLQVFSPATWGGATIQARLALGDAWSDIGRCDGASDAGFGETFIHCFLLGDAGQAFRFYRFEWYDLVPEVRIVSWEAYGLGGVSDCGSPGKPCRASVELPAIGEQRGAAMFGIVLVYGLFWLLMRRVLLLGLGLLLVICLALSVFTGQDTWLMGWLLAGVIFSLAEFLRNRLGLG